MSKPYTLRPILDPEAEGEAVAEILANHPEVTRSFDLRDVDGDPAGILLRGPEGWWFFYDSLRRWSPAYPTRSEALVALDAAVEALSAPLVGSYKVGVKTPGDRDWVYNALRFPTVDTAEEYGKDLAWRWTAVQSYEVHPSEDAPNR
jgi:hypothetical protein